MPVMGGQRLMARLVPWFAYSKIQLNSTVFTFARVFDGNTRIHFPFPRIHTLGFSLEDYLPTVDGRFSTLIRKGYVRTC